MNFTQILITGQKGGTGKTTFSALLTDYLLYLKKKVNSIDSDPQFAYQGWISNCQQEGRVISRPLPADYQIIDTAGVAGGTPAFNNVSVIIIPFVIHFVDLKVILTNWQKLPIEQQKRTLFIPNRFQKTKEQRQGLQQIQELLVKTGHGQLVEPFPHRPALLGDFLNG
jgi:cellulose biosynthesis protein BcsQ